MLTLVHGSALAKDSATESLAAYFSQLESSKLIDSGSGNINTLRTELAFAENLLGGGAHMEAAVALYSIVMSPRYTALVDFIEYQNAEYDLGVALLRGGAFGAASDALARVLQRGSSASYWAPAHRKLIDIAIETRAHTKTLAMLAAADKAGDTIPPSAAGERAYLRGRAAYEANDFGKADTELGSVSKQSRLYSSALYLRGVISARQGKYRRSAQDMCEVAGMADASRLAFVVDQRYFTLKDLARLGLGRLAHEQGRYDDAYYHYFQIPDDSTYLAEALFEAAWSMYQKRELPTARDLTKEFLAAFPNSPLWPEATLLAGYVELADCKFDSSQKLYDDLAARLTPLVEQLDQVRKDPSQTLALFDRALGNWRSAKQQGDSQGVISAKTATTDANGQVLGLLQIDPLLVRLSDTLNGMNQVAGQSPGTVKLWQDLRQQVSSSKVAASSSGSVAADGKSQTVADVGDAEQLLAETRALAEAARDQRKNARDASPEERKQLAALLDKVTKLEQQVGAAASAAAQVAKSADAAGNSLPAMIDQDVASARLIGSKAAQLRQRMSAAAQTRAMQSIERVYNDTKRVLDKARLGKIDAVIGQKRKLDIDVQDLAAGRFPAELIGRMWDQSLIGDDEELWPAQGDFWADEYEGWR
jgi:tetratricopeptide (TPR) repeat protein